VSKLIGRRKREYLADVVRQDLDLEADAADRLTERLDEAIRSLRTTKEQRAKARSEAPRPVSGARPSPSFDPFFINAILVLKHKGREGLATQLAPVTEVQHLRQFAEAQMIGLDQAMRAGDVSADDLREAIVSGVERVFANRRLAGS
jgi:hypothetical protein